MGGSTIDDNASDCISGTLKWFSPSRGYGFVVCNNTGQEALLHQNILHDFGQNSVAAGYSIKASTCETTRGLQVVKILDLKAPVPESGSAVYKPARVKWFCGKKLYGFVNVFEDKRDCFLHAKTLESAGFASVNAGEALGVEIAERPSGRMVIAVKPWI